MTRLAKHLLVHDDRRLSRQEAQLHRIAPGGYRADAVVWSCFTQHRVVRMV